MKQKKRVQITNLSEYFEAVEFNTFTCLSELEKKVQQSEELIDWISCEVNSNRDAIFTLKGVKVDHRDVKVFYYQFNETVS
jgi:hypothetical protein